MDNQFSHRDTIETNTSNTVATAFDNTKESCVNEDNENTNKHSNNVKGKSNKKEGDEIIITEVDNTENNNHVISKNKVEGQMDKSLIAPTEFKFDIPDKPITSYENRLMDKIFDHSLSVFLEFN